MSGGVDSSVTAALLAEQGHEVVGLFMRLGVGGDDGGERRCCSLEDGRDAARVADKIGVRFYDLDYRGSFRPVIDYFVDSYNQGETPNPCVMCNRDVKFDTLWTQARQMGCDAIATGHYARIIDTPTGSALARGVDLAKDQSYFLFPIDRTVLPHVHFPLGELTKPRVRELAAEFDLPTKKKSESQDICFVGQATYGDVLKRETPDALKTGDIRDTAGKLLGQHEGQQLYTLGQRRGLGVAAPHPLYVVDKNAATNTVILGTRDHLMTDTLEIDMFQWHHRPEIGEEIEVMIRYNGDPLPAIVEDLGESGRSARLNFPSLQEKTADGQAAVVYRDDYVLGGGWIRKLG